MSDQPKEMIYPIIAATLASVMVCVIVVMLIGLFSPVVDNNKIFEILGPAFQSIVGAFIGIISGRFMASSSKDKE